MAKAAFDMDLDEYNELSSDERYNLLGRHREENSKALTAAWEGGVVCLVFAGKNPTPIFSAEMRKDVPTSDELLAMKEENSAPAFLHVAPIEIDSF